MYTFEICETRGRVLDRANVVRLIVNRRMHENKVLGLFF
jgi:hypothetical protein